MNFGDLVRVNGYWPRVFRIVSYRIESYFEPVGQWTETVYEMYDVETDEYIEADREDLTVVAPADKAEEYLAANPPQPKFTGLWTEVFGTKWGSGKPKEPPKPSARELSAKEAERRKRERRAKAVKIDALLDELNDYKRLVAEFGDEEYRAKVEYITLKLAEASAE